MNPIQWHLALAHLPVVGLPFCLLVLSVATWREDRFWQTLGLWLTLGVALTGGVAYFTGGASLEALAVWLERSGESEATIRQLTALAETHALLARVTLIGSAVLGVVVLNGLATRLQGEEPSRWLFRAAIVLLIILCWLLAWTAHLGGHIRHPEAHDPAWGIFPHFDEVAE